eukprot:CAMPEP_0113942608 /NCGR_PEP_ID=MMETSP1339-20121228/8286_1 /TAXON_ID=94617 /ORGANISM="Fibrocapsa japonica" /LENGTH=92 /DNA_ID=CAMNT_0000947131 /DNA_START=186 /DNA_END=464 /DNA_ORIENTATION=+ /assembly_acc=CAM_ASM_000762
MPTEMEKLNNGRPSLNIFIASDSEEDWAAASPPSFWFRHHCHGHSHGQPALGTTPSLAGSSGEGGSWGRGRGGGPESVVESPSCDRDAVAAR